MEEQSIQMKRDLSPATNEEGEYKDAAETVSATKEVVKLKRRLDEMECDL